MSKRILIVEDNQDMRQELMVFLRNEGFKITDCGSTEDAIDEVDEHDFDLVLIDINLPGKSGYSLIEYIREEGKTMPLIAMTARDKVDDKIKGFDLGLTDYIVKPFSLIELRARIAAHLRNAGPTNESADVQTNNFHIRPEAMQFMVKGNDVELTQLEFRILHKLMLNRGTLVTIDDLVSYAWGDEDLSNPPIRIHIANIRKKIQDTSYEIIRTIPGTGYIFEDKEA